MGSPSFIKWAKKPFRWELHPALSLDVDSADIFGLLKSSVSESSHDARLSDHVHSFFKAAARSEEVERDADLEPEANIPDEEREKNEPEDAEGTASSTPCRSWFEVRML